MSFPLLWLRGPAHHPDQGPPPPADLSRSHAFLEIELMPYFCSKGTETGISPILQMGKRRSREQSHWLFSSVARTPVLGFPDQLFLRLPPPTRRLLRLKCATRLCRGSRRVFLTPGCAVSSLSRTGTRWKGFRQLPRENAKRTGRRSKRSRGSPHGVRHRLPSPSRYWAPQRWPILQSEGQTLPGQEVTLAWLRCPGTEAEARRTDRTPQHV